MACQLVVFALILITVVGHVVADEAPTTSPTSSPKSSPSPVEVSANLPESFTPQSSPSPKSSAFESTPTPSTTNTSPASSPSSESEAPIVSSPEADVSSPPAPTTEGFEGPAPTDSFNEVSDGPFAAPVHAPAKASAPTQKMSVTIILSTLVVVFYTYQASHVNGT